MDITLLHHLLRALPLYSEEGGLREEIKESDLLRTIAGDAGAATLAVVRRLFEACSLLDQRLLLEDIWAFVSFPAALVGHSLLQTLASPGQTLLEDDYWHQESNNIEAQRLILHSLESRRASWNKGKCVPPIRYVFVAWALIRLGGRFLLHHREDRSRPEVKNYVLPGGRFNPGDLPLDLQVPEILRELHCSGSPLVCNSLPRTLARELREETGLVEGSDYAASPRVLLDPYRRVEGAGSKHAFTEYLIKLHDVSLTPEGETKLLETISSGNEKLVWFSIEDLVAPTGRTDGKAAFIDALKAHFDGSFLEFLQKTPSSSTLPYRFNTRANAVEIPMLATQAVAVGETGKEKSVETHLSEGALALMQIAAANAKSMAPDSDEFHVKTLPGGWVKAESSEAIASLAELGAGLETSGLRLLDIVREKFFRLSVSTDILYFNDSAFTYHLSEEVGGTGLLIVEFRIPPSRYAGPTSGSARISLKSSMLQSLMAIVNGEIGPGELEPYRYSDETFKKSCKEMLDDRIKPLGLRKLVRQSNKRYLIEIKRAEP